MRESDPRVVLSFPPRGVPREARPSTLDPTRPDDQIIREVLDFIESYPSDEVFLLTNDTGPMLTARYHNVRFIEVPDDWLLEPEPDERDKTIQDLKRRLDSLERTHPIIEISACTNDRPITALQEEVLLFEPLAEHMIEELVQEIHGWCPVADNFGLSSTELLFRRTAALGLGEQFRYTPPTADEISTYRDVDYPAWLTHIRQVLVNAPLRLNKRKHAIGIQFRIANRGTVPANNTLVEIEAHGEVLIQVPGKRRTEFKDSKSFHLPHPPKPASGHFDETHSPLSAASYLSRSGSALSSVEAMHAPIRALPAERNRNEFYWAEKSLKPSKFLSLTCEEFRHQDDVEEFDVVVRLARGKIVSGAVSCRLSATNLPEHAKLTIPVKSLVTKADCEKHV